MKLRLLFAGFATLILAHASQAQIAVDNTFTVQQLVEDYLIGDGVQVDNITINGEPAGTVNTQAGVYTGPSDVVNFPLGVVMATGNAVGVVTGGFGGGGLSNPVTNDPDLMAISGQNINDAIIIEFDFLSTSDSIKFNYVFASDEYPSFTCSTFNDAFGFFLSGGTINGPYTNNAVNIALIPDTDIPVAINTVNSGTASGTYSPDTCEAANPNWIADSQYFVSNAGLPADDVNFPGLTTTLTALADVDCGVWYHIKLAIGDALDGGYDSGVFLQAGSFAAFGDVFLAVTPTIGGSAVSNPDYDSVLVAGCSEAYIELTRPLGLPIDSIFVQFGGTAIQQSGTDPIVGADYELGDNDTLFFFPEGIDTIGFTITTIWDQIPDENEYIVITILYTDGCGDLKTASDTIYIVDPYSISSLTEDVVVTCPADNVSIMAQGLDGIDPYTYDWGDFGQGEELIDVSVPVPPEEKYYYVSITDVCNFEIVVDSVLVTNNIPDPLQASIDGFSDPECPNGAVDLNANIQDGNGEYTIIWTDGKGNGYLQNPEITVGNINSVILFDPEPSNFTDVLPVYLTVIDTCGTIVNDSTIINFPFFDPLTANFNPLTDNCPEEPVELRATVEEGAGQYNYIWGLTNGDFASGADPTGQTTYVVPEGGMNEYSLVATDFCSRQGFDYRYYINENELAFSGSAIYTDSLRVLKLDRIMNVITPNGDDKNDYFVIQGVEEFDDSRLEVYDRWGKLIYETDNYRAGVPDQKPDNVFDADGFEDGTYFYIINVDSGECVTSGTIEVLRGNN